jgi:formylglycine-generating enzyme
MTRKTLQRFLPCLHLPFLLLSAMRTWQSWRHALFAGCTLALTVASGWAGAAWAGGPVLASNGTRPAYKPLPAGIFKTVLPPDGKQGLATVRPFSLRVLPVSNGEFSAFTRKSPQWRAKSVAAVFADGQYLSHWTASGLPGKEQLAQPVTNVSWFAAQAYCESEGARLPTWHEWEYAAAADERRADARDDPAWRERILSWYSRKSAPLPGVGSTVQNIYGIQDLHGVIWEWVHDASALMVSGDSRNQGDADTLQFCGAGALSANDRENYPVLMRIAMLSSLGAASTTRNLGFRCARDVTQAKTRRSTHP